LDFQRILFDILLKRKKKKDGEKKIRAIDLYNIRKTNNIVPSTDKDIPIWLIKACRDFICNKKTSIYDMSPADGKKFFRRLNVMNIKERNAATVKTITEVDDEDDEEELETEAEKAATGTSTTPPVASKDAAVPKEKTAKEKEKEKEKEKLKKSRAQPDSQETTSLLNAEKEAQRAKKEEERKKEKQLLQGLQGGDRPRSINKELGKYYKHFEALPPEEKVRLASNPDKLLAFRRQFEEEDLQKFVARIGKKKAYPDAADPARVIYNDIMKELKGIPKHVWDDPYYPDSLFRLDMDPEARDWAISQLDKLRTQVVDPKTGEKKWLTIDDLPDDIEQGKNTIITDIWGPDSPTRFSLSGGSASSSSASKGGKPQGSKK